MGNLTLAYRARSYSTGTLGRALCNARTHHFVADDAGGEAIGAGELFFSGISACAVNMVERLANAGQIPLQWMDVHVEAYRDAEKPPGDLTVRYRRDQRLANLALSPLSPQWRIRLDSGTTRLS